MAKLNGKAEWIFKVAVPLPVNRLFDYLAPKNCDLATIKPGIRLKVPFARSSKTGYLIAVSQKSDIALEKLKRVEQVIDSDSLLTAVDIKLLHWLSQYYHHALGEVFNAAFPVALRQGKPAVIQAEQKYRLTELGQTIDCEQLKRAPRQQVVLEKFKQHPGSLSESELTIWTENWRPTVKQLLNKQLIESDTEIELPTQALVDSNDVIVANPHQQHAIEQICHSLGQFAVFLLQGVTGSGKTEVYMQSIQAVLAKDQQVLVLLPEITLTPQLEQRFQQRFNVSIALSHSKLTDNQRQSAWLKMQQGQSSILLGTRSALFTPLKKPGLIILDEEHDSSFKQQEGFRFSARDVAVVRSKMLNVPVILGTATPSLESLHNVNQRRYQLLQLPKRAGQAQEPVLKLLDIRNQRMQEGLSEVLLQEISKTLKRGEQVLLFLNRRGFAPTLICHSCGWVARCQRCDANMVIHYDEGLLRCHHCTREQPVIKLCPGCKTGELTPLGLGTERVEKVLGKFYIDKRIVRLDKDSTSRKGSLEKYLQQINDGQVDIILGTQLLAKGHHFPEVTLVAILDVDSGLFSIDFHAQERLAQMIVQVAGRAGRAQKPGRVILQTRQPEHPLLTTLIAHGYSSFAKMALLEREQAGLPPYSHQALLRVVSIKTETAKAFLQQLTLIIESMVTDKVLILGPVPAPMPKRAGRFRYQLLLQSQSRKDLHALLTELIPKIEVLKQAKKVRWSLDVDPVDLY